jgi:cell envelope opacity-associated protein A
MSLLKTMSNFSLEYIRTMTKNAKIKTPPLKCSLATQNVSIQQLFWPDHRKQASIIIDSVMNKYWY